jgi:hypothetical protein
MDGPSPRVDHRQSDNSILHETLIICINAMRNINITVQVYMERLHNVKEEFLSQSSQHLETC